MRGQHLRRAGAPDRSQGGRQPAVERPGGTDLDPVHVEEFPAAPGDQLGEPIPILIAQDLPISHPGEHPLRPRLGLLPPFTSSRRDGRPVAILVHRVAVLDGPGVGPRVGVVAVVPALLGGRVAVPVGVRQRHAVAILVHGVPGYLGGAGVYCGIGVVAVVGGEVAVVVLVEVGRGGVGAGGRAVGRGRAGVRRAGVGRHRVGFGARAGEEEEEGHSTSRAPSHQPPP